MAFVSLQPTSPTIRPCPRQSRSPTEPKEGIFLERWCLGPCEHILELLRSSEIPLLGSCAPGTQGRREPQEGIFLARSSLLGCEHSLRPSRVTPRYLPGALRGSGTLEETLRSLCRCRISDSVHLLIAQRFDVLHIELHLAVVVTVAQGQDDLGPDELISISGQVRT